MKVLLFGATGSLGYELTKELINLKYDLTICGRNEDKILNLLVDLDTKLNYYILDMMNVDECLNASKYILDQNFDVIIFNQGIYDNRHLTNKDGLESHFMVNAFSEYLILKYVLPRVDNMMVVTVSSISCYNIKEVDIFGKNIKKWHHLYRNSKLLQLQIIKELEEKYDNISFTYAHPGICYTKLSSGLHSKFINFFVKKFMMKPNEAIKPILASINGVKKGYWWAPKGLFQLVGKPSQRKIRKRCLNLENKNKIELDLIEKELKEKYEF